MKRPLKNTVLPASQ